MARDRLAVSARRGASVSFVTSPAQTRSQSARQDHAFVAGPGRLHQVGPERRAVPCEVLADRDVERTGRRLLRRRRREEPHLVADVKRDAAVVGPECSGSDPHQVAARAQLVQVHRTEPTDTGGQDVVLQDRRRDGGALQASDRVHQGVRTGRRRHESLPRRQEPPERRGVDGLDLLSERGERPATEPSEHVDVAPLAFDAPPAVRGAELAVGDASARLQRIERDPDAIRAGAQPGRRLAGEGTARACGRIGRRSSRADAPSAR